MNTKFSLILIVLIAAILRLVWLTDYPVGFTADEAQQGYDAYSILTTSKDHWGVAFPLFPRGFGDYKPPLLTYLIIPTVAIFGLSEFSTRLPAALIGIIMILVTYYLTLALFKKRGIAILSALLLAINPWHIQLSRTAFEANTGILFFCLGILFWLKAQDQTKYFFYSLCLFGLTLYSYHSFRVVTPLFLAVLLVPYVLKKDFLKKNISKIILGVIIFSIFLLPLVLNFQLLLKRSSDISIFSEISIQNYFENRASSNLPTFLARGVDNKYLYILSTGFSNYLSYFSPYFFFTGSRPGGTYLNFPYTPLYFGIEIITISLAVYLIFIRREKFGGLLLAWALLAPIPAALTDSLSANRAVSFVPLMTILSGYGLYELTKILKSKRMNYLNYSIYVVIFLSFWMFLYTYIYKVSKFPPENLRYGFDVAFPKLLSISDAYQSVKFSKKYSMPHIFIAFYSVNLNNGITPEFVQMESKDWLRYEKADKKYVDQLESYNLGKFIFGNINLPEDMRVENSLLISDERDFPPRLFTSIYDKTSPEGKMIFRFIPTIGASFEKTE